METGNQFITDNKILSIFSKKWRNMHKKVVTKLSILFHMIQY